MSETIFGQPRYGVQRSADGTPRVGSLSLGDKCAIGVGVLLCLGMYRWLVPSPWLRGLAAGSPPMVS
ncbi:hypothetical protein [Mycobacterium sp.]|jgi:hypothetical protein|uniref:hypothetical protein n=1 Tax=Mycobacterium sp. TaxID=1785 RepID=UPI002618CE40|nr:hypothetical protein [Mycobacterium sp.]